MRSFTVPFALSIVASLVACSSPPEGPSAAEEGRGTLPAGSYEQYGSIAVDQVAYPTGQWSTHIGAQLGSIAAPAAVQGGCHAVDVPAGDITQTTAGAISIDDGRYVLDLDSSSKAPKYKSIDADLRLFEPGKVVHASAPGVDAPAFDIRAPAPENIIWKSPSYTKLGDALTGHRKDGLSLTWTGGDKGWVQLVFHGAPVGTPMVCAFPASDHHATIPPSAFDAFQSGAANMTWEMNVFSTAFATQGRWAYQLSLQAHALPAEGGAFDMADSDEAQQP